MSLSPPAPGVPEDAQHRLPQVPSARTVPGGGTGMSPPVTKVGNALWVIPNPSPPQAAPAQGSPWVHPWIPQTHPIASLCLPPSQLPLPEPLESPGCAEPPTPCRIPDGEQGTTTPRQDPTAPPIPAGKIPIRWCDPMGTEGDTSRPTTPKQLLDHRFPPQISFCCR